MGGMTANPPRPDHAARSASASTMRRVPVQQRSARRVERILDAAASLVAEDGYEATTTSRIAARAGVPVATLYQFFADRRAVLRAVSARNLEHFLERLDEIFRWNTFEHWWDATAAMFDTYVEMYSGDVGFRTVIFGDIVDTHLLEAEHDNDTVVAMRMAQLLRERFDVRIDDETRKALLMAITLSDHLVALAFRSDPNGDPHVLAETRVILRDLLERHFSM